jgi:uncharacterized OsmC-like protein
MALIFCLFWSFLESVAPERVTCAIEAVTSKKERAVRQNDLKKSRFDYSNVNLDKLLNMTSRVVYQGALRTTCTHLQSGSAIETDAPVDNQGKGERFSPTDLLATSLATCMLTVMGIKARDMEIDMTGLSISVQKNMLSDPRRVGSIELFATIPASLQALEEKAKQVLKRTGESCPVIKSIHHDIVVTIDWAQWA